MFTPFAFVKSVAAAPAFDSDAQAYLDAVVSLGGTTDTTIDNAVNTLFVDLKSAGLYSKIFAMYPMIGIASASQALNAKDPTPISSSFYIDYLKQSERPHGHVHKNKQSFTLETKIVHKFRVFI